MRENILAPSILAADFKILGEEIRRTEESGAKYLHFDVMDGMFVPNISFGVPVLASIKDGTSQVMDAHLMVTEPIRYVEAFAKAGADIITVHYEACQDLQATIDKIKECGVKTGLSIKPKTPASVIAPILHQLDMVLVMSVEPGFGGQKLIPECLEKATEIRRMIDEAGLNIDIQMDGGIDITNAATVLDAGVNVLVAGSAVFKDTTKNTKKFMEILNAHE